MMTRLVFAAVLYPSYIKESLDQHDAKLTYSQYLLSKGFNYSHINRVLNSDFYKKVESRNPKIDISFAGTEEQFVDKYGISVLDTLNLVKKIRIANSLLLVIAIATMTLLLLNEKGFWFSIAFMVVLAFNTILVSSGLKAHSEAIFMFWFAWGIVFLNQTSKKSNFINIILVSVSTGFLVSTKLNGILLYPVIILTMLVQHLQNNTRSYLNLFKKVVFSTIIIFGVFLLLNPFLISNPLVNVVKMFEHRFETAVWQSMNFDSVGLFSFQDRILAIYRNLFLNDGSNFGVIMYTIFIAGVWFEYKKILVKSTSSYVWALTGTLLFLSMLFYLVIDWSRYYVPLVIFVVYYQVCGVQYLTLIAKSRFNRFDNK